MKLQYVLYMVLLLSRHSIVKGDKAKVAVTYNITDKVYTCSSWLSGLINGFCDNVLKIAKRDTSVMIDKLMPRSLLEHRNKERVLTEERWQRVRRQVANECCDKPCTVATIIKYCPNDARLLKERPEIFDYS